MQYYNHENNFIALFNSLGESIRKEWSKENYNEDMLPSIAARQLKKFSLHESISASDVLNQALNVDSAISAHQVHSPFGDLQLIPYRHNKFYIEILYWAQGTTSIHDHAFSGAFYVLEGSSINVQYDFQFQDKINHHFHLGALKEAVSTRLQKGSVQEIASGRKFIHAVYHLKNPTISIVVRTYQNDDAMPQLEYRGRHIALVSDLSPDLTKKIQALKFILKDVNKDSLQIFIDVLNSSPQDDQYWILRTFYSWLIKSDHISECLSHMTDENSERILTTIHEEYLLTRVIETHASISDPEVKEIVAVIMNLPTWQSIIEFLSPSLSENPSNPSDIAGTILSKLKEADLISDPNLFKQSFADFKLCPKTLPALDKNNALELMIITKIALSNNMREKQ